MVIQETIPCIPNGFEFILQQDKKSELVLFNANFLPVLINFHPRKICIQSHAFRENSGEVTLECYSCVIANYFEDAAVLCVGLTLF